MNRYLFGLLMLMLFLPGAADTYAQDKPLAGELPVPYGPSNMGRDFWLAFPANWDLPGSTEYYIRLYITSNVRTQVKVWVGPGIKKILYTVPNGVVWLDITPVEAQMFVRSDQPPVPPDRIFKRKAVHIHAEAPIAVYGMNRTTYSSDGLLALPTSALGHEYIVASYGAVIGVTQELPSQYMIVAPYNGTSVTIYHPHRTPSHAANETFTISLDSGDVWSALSVGYGGDMSGAVIRASKPVAVIAGAACAYIPNLLNFCCCNHLTEMMIPTEAWGKLYHAVPLRTRVKGDFYRIFAKDSNTKLHINGAEYATLTRTGGEEGTGWIEYRAIGKGVQEFKANKPIQVVQYNTSQAYDGVASDPFYMALTPVEQYQTHILFCTPAADFTRNFMNFICDSAGYYELEITKAGENAWQTVWNMEGADVAKPFASLINGSPYFGSSIELLPGTYELRSTYPFTGYLYGFSMHDAYGYPIGLATNVLDKTDRDAPGLTKTQSCDGTVEVTVRELPTDASIRTGIATIEFSSDAGSNINYSLQVTPFEAGMSIEASYRLTVNDRSKPAMAIIVISDMAGNITTDTVRYIPSGSTVLPSPLVYGKVRVGEKHRKVITITNESIVSRRLDEFRLKSNAEGYTILRPTGPVTLGPKGSSTESVQVEIEFTGAASKPGSQQIFQDSLGVRDTCGLRYVALVQAQVVKPMIEVTDIDYEKRPVGSGLTRQMDVTNVSPIESSTLTITAMSGPKNAAIFDLETGSQPQFPFTLEPGQSRALLITATAPDESTHMDTVFFTSDAMDVDEGDSYGWLRIEGDGISSVDNVAGMGAISAMNVLPNPVEGDETTVEYRLARRGMAGMDLLDVSGRTLRVVQHAVVQEAGTYRIVMDVQGLAAGTYFVRMTLGDEVRIRRFMVK